MELEVPGEVGVCCRVVDQGRRDKGKVGSGASWAPVTPWRLHNQTGPWGLPRGHRPVSLRGLPAPEEKSPFLGDFPQCLAPQGGAEWDARQKLTL